MKRILLVVGAGILLVSLVQTNVLAFNSGSFDKFADRQQSATYNLIDKMTYLCLQMEKSDGLDQLEQDKQQRCNSLLDKLDLEDEQRLIEKYGEIE